MTGERIPNPADQEYRTLPAQFCRRAASSTGTARCIRRLACQRSRRRRRMRHRSGAGCSCASLAVTACCCLCPRGRGRCVCSRSYILHRLGSESGSQGRRVPLAGACQPPAEYCRESSRQTHCRSGISTFEPSPETCSETSERMPCADGNTRVEVHVPPCVEVHAAHECVYNVSNGEVYHQGELDGNVPVCESLLRRTLRVFFKSGGL